MNATLSLPPLENLDTVMLRVARDIAMDIYPLQDILKNNDLTVQQFQTWQNHPQFVKYVQSEKEAWTAASNTAERTKLKAGIVMEMFMEEAHNSLHDKKTPLNQRVELGKLVARIAGMGSPAAGIPGAGGPGGFRLQINIGPGKEGHQPQQITISADHSPLIDNYSDDDGYDPFTSPNTLED